MNEGSLLCLNGADGLVPRPMEFISLRFLPRPESTSKTSAGCCAGQTDADPEIGRGLATVPIGPRVHHCAGRYWL